MKNIIKKLIPAGIAIAGLTLSSCNPFNYENKAPIVCVPPLTRVYEGEEYHYQIQSYDPEGKPLEYSVKMTTINPLSPKWALSVSSFGLVQGEGTAPKIDKDTDYNVEINISDGEKVTDLDYILHEQHVQIP